jgi:hypothetical protein
VTLTLQRLAGVYAVCRMEAGAPPEWALAALRDGPFASLTRTPDELSLVCAEMQVPPGVRCERGFACLKVAGPLDFALTGVLAGLAAPLAQAGISLFAVATYDTDYLLVRQADLDAAVAALRAAGHSVG